MSFVYAKKVSDTILILGDTKITFDETEGRMLWTDEKTRADVNKFGLVKNVIAADKVCIGYAGDNVIEASNLLARITRDQLQFDEILSSAFEIHMKHDDFKIDFLLCYADGERREIYQIKNGRCEEVDHAWIGSYDAFNCFQSYYHTDKLNRNEENGFDDMTVSYRVYGKYNFNDEVEKIFNAFYYTIYNCGDDSVGGFAIKALYNDDNGSFEYQGYAKNISYTQTHDLAVMMRNTAQDGDYTIIQYNSKNQVGVFVLHANVGLIYGLDRISKEDAKNEDSNMLYVPFSMRILQLDYYIQTEELGFVAPLYLNCNPFDFDEIYKRLEHYKDNPKIVLKYVNKLLEILCSFPEYEEKKDELVNLKNEQLRIINGDI